MLATGRYAGILLKIDDYSIATEVLNCQNAGVKTVPHTHHVYTFNEESGTMQTSTPNIYCIGDARYNNVELTPVWSCLNRVIGTRLPSTKVSTWLDICLLKKTSPKSCLWSTFQVLCTLPWNTVFVACQKSRPLNFMVRINWTFMWRNTIHWNKKLVSVKEQKKDWASSRYGEFLKRRMGVDYCKEILSSWDCGSPYDRSFNQWCHSRTECCHE